MKNIFYKSFFVLLILVIAGFGFHNSDKNTSMAPYAVDFRNVIPDVMNKVNIFDYYTGHFVITDADSLPVFPGFPKTITGSTFEGAITCNMDSDPELEIVINITYTVQAFNLDGSNVTGWPKTVSSYPLEGAPAFGDIDGDGIGEIVVTNHGLTSGGYIYAFERDGSTVTGFPINHGYSTRTPVLADLDNDNKCEIIINKRISSIGEVWVYKSDGTVYPGWPKPINHVPASSSAVGDIDGDNQPDIISESYISLYAWKSNGDTIPGFPYNLPTGVTNSYSSPVLADLNGDNKREIIFGTHGSGGNYVYVLKYDGTVYTGWPKPVNYWIYGPPAVGFIDGDNILDIAIGDQVLSGTPVDYLYAWNANGTPLAGFPAGPLNAINCQPILADIDNDNQTEIIVDDNTQTGGKGKYLAFNHDGTPVTGWPVEVNGSSFFSTPALTDIDRNNVLDMVGAGTTGGTGSVVNVYLWNCGVPYVPSKIQIPNWQYNPRHTGVYNQLELTGITGTPPKIPSECALGQNYPNPFNPSTSIEFSVPKNGYVSLKVFDIAGRTVSLLINGYRNAGKYTVNFDASDLPGGIYFYRLTADGFTEARKMVLIK